MIIETGDRNGSYWKIQEVSKQSKPHVAPLPYTSYGGSATPSFTHWPNGSKTRIDIANDIPLANGYEWDHHVIGAQNKALDKLYEMMAQSESMRVAWKERESALKLVTDSTKYLIDVARAVRRRDPNLVRKIFRTSKKSRKRDVATTPASLWLQYHFAIVPTIMDIHHALGIFSQEFPSPMFDVSSGTSYSTVVKTPTTYGNGRETKTDVIVKLGGRFLSVDPNVSLASSLGFGQPLSVGYEMTMMSWALDYFANVGDLLKNLEPRFPGFTFADEYTTVFKKCSGTLSQKISYHWEEVLDINFESFYVRRSLGWPAYQMQFTSPLDLKVKQVSYLVSVLVQLLAGSLKK